MAKRGDPPSLPAGQVQVTEIGKGWWQVAIGRERWTKVFNLSASEIPTLLEQLSQVDLRSNHL